METSQFVGHTVAVEWMHTVVDEVAGDDDDIGTLRIDEIHIAGQILTPRTLAKVYVAHGNDGEGLRGIIRLVKYYGHHIDFRVLVTVMTTDEHYGA